MAKIPNSQASTAPPWTGSVRTIMLFAFVIFLVLAAFIVRAALPIAIFSVIAAYILYPLKRFLQRRVFRGRSGPAVAVTVLLIFAVVVIVILTVIPTLVIQGANFIETAIVGANRFITEPLVIGDYAPVNEDGEPFILLEEFLDLFNEVLSSTQDGEAGALPPFLQFGQDDVERVLGVAGDFVGLSFRLVGSVAAATLNTLFILMLLSYFLSDGQKMIENIIEIAPDGYERDIRRLFWELGRIWNDYLRGQLILGLITGVLMWLMATILGLSNSVFLAVFAGFMEFIPNIGPVLAMIPPIIVALISGSSTFPNISVFLLVGIIVAVWIVVQQFGALVLQPRIMGGSLNLHPVVIVLGVVVGGSLAGVVGVILSAPTIATARILIQYVYGRLAEEPPFRNNPDFDDWLQANAPHLRYEPEYVDPEALPLPPMETTQTF